MNSVMKLREALEEIPILDTHEHFLPPRFIASGEATLIRILRNSYAGADFISAGSEATWWGNGSIVYGSVDLAKMADMSPTDVEIVWQDLPNVQHTAYFRMLHRGLEALHGLQGELGPESWESLSSSVKEAYNQQGWFDKVLEKLNVQLVLWDGYFAVPGPEIWSERVIPVFHTDDFLDYPWAHPMGGRSAAEVAHSWGISLDRLDDLLKAIDHGFTLYQSLGARAVKIGVAYRRSLLFDHVSYDEANRAFDKLRESLVEEARIALGNYTVRHILRRAAEAGLIVQVHTGYIIGHLDQGRPTYLVNLFLEYPEVKFVLFHGGYPYSDEAGLLAKTFPNVYLDMCWMPSLSQTMAQEVLRRWFDLVPMNKIMWGGDVWSVEECAGALEMFKDMLANALGGMISDGIMTEGSALESAHGIMHRNASTLFGLKVT